MPYTLRWLGRTGQLVLVAGALSSCRGSLRGVGRVSVGFPPTAQATERVNVDLPSVLDHPTDSSAALSADFRMVSETTKLAAWPRPFAVGDCRSEDVGVSIKSNGTGRLESLSSVSSPRSANWSWALSGLDSLGVVLWRVPFHRGPSMDGARQQAPYRNDFDFGYDSTTFAKTSSVRASGIC
jgi:hypothetical protein